MLNFAMFLANSDQEIIWTIQFDPYCPYKVFIVSFFSTNAFKKLN